MASTAAQAEESYQNLSDGELVSGYRAGSSFSTIHTAACSVEMGITSTGGCTFPTSNSEQMIQCEESTREVSGESRVPFVEFARKIGQSVMFLTCALHIVSVVVCFLERQSFWAGGLILLFFFDVYAGFCALKGQGCHFWTRSFDRCMVGIISAITVFYGFYDDCPQVIPRRFRFVFYAAGWVSVMSVAFSSLEIDSSSNNDVARDLARSPQFAIRHIALRTSEAATKVFTWVLLCSILRPLLGRFISREVIVAILMMCFFIAVVLLYSLIILVCSRVPGLPKESISAAVILGVLNLAVNPITFLFDNVWYRKPARRIATIFRLLRVLEMVGVAALVWVTWEVERGCAVQGTVPGTIGKEIESQESLLFQLVFCLWAEVFFSVTSTRLCGGSLRFSSRNHATGIPFMPGVGARWDVQGVPEMSMGTYLMFRGSSRSGILARFVPMNPVVPNFFVVEKLLGQGGYGVVVKVRQDGVGGQKPNFFALKLQHTGSNRERDRDSQGGLRSPRELAMREREVYRRIWEHIDPETGRLGHPFIVRLVCYSDWPQEKQLFYESNNQPVQFYKNEGHGGGVKAVNRFDTALLMEFCEQGSLETYVPLHMRRSEHDRDKESNIQWLYRARLFIGEILIALDFLHNTKSVIYRDLKPDNVFVAQDQNGNPHVKLGDFGFSKVVTAMDQPVSVAGTPYFCAPEILVMHRENRTADTDWTLDTYSLGMLIFVLFYGAKYEKSRDRWAMAHQLRVEPLPKALHELALQPRCPQSVVSLVENSTKRKPKDRLSVADMKNSPLFGELELEDQTKLPHFPWTKLRGGII